MALIVIILVATLLRFVDLGHKCFYSDEVFTYGVSLGERYDNSTPSLFYSLSRPLFNLPFVPEINCRILPALFGVILIIIMFYLAKEIQGGAFPYFVSAITAINPLLIQISQEFRAYSMITLLTALNLWAVLKWWKIVIEGSKPELKLHYKWGLLFVLSGALGFYTHYLIIPYLLAVGLVLFLMILLQRNPRTNLIALAVVFFALGLLILPGLPEFYYKYTHFGEPENRSFIDIFTIKTLLRSFWGFFLGYNFHFYWISLPGDTIKHIDRVALLVLTLLLQLLVVKSIFSAYKRGGVEKYLLGLWFLLIILYPLALLSSYRQMAPLLFIFIILLGLGIMGLALKWRRVAIAVLLMVTVPSLVWYYRLPFPPLSWVDWRGAGKYLEVNVKEGEAVFAACSDLALLALDFYYDGEIIPVDDQARLYHTSPQQLKREEHIDRVLIPYYAQKTAEVLQEYPAVYVVLSSHLDRITNLATKSQPVSVKNFGPMLEIKKFVRGNKR